MAELKINIFPKQRKIWTDYLLHRQLVVLFHVNHTLQKIITSIDNNLATLSSAIGYAYVCFRCKNHISYYWDYIIICQPKA